MTLNRAIHQIISAITRFFANIARSCIYSSFVLLSFLAFIGSVLLYPLYFLQHAAYVLKIAVFNLSSGRFGLSEIWQSTGLTPTQKILNYMDPSANIFIWTREDISQLPNYILFKYGSKAFCKLFIHEGDRGTLASTLSIILTPLISIFTAMFSTMIHAAINAEKTFNVLAQKCFAREIKNSLIFEFIMGTPQDLLEGAEDGFISDPVVDPEDRSSFNINIEDNVIQPRPIVTVFEISQQIDMTIADKANNDQNLPDLDPMSDSSSSPNPPNYSRPNSSSL